MRPHSLVIRAVALLGLLCGWGALVRAEPAPGGASAQVAIRVIFAVKDTVKSIDPQLQDIQGELQELPFSKFRLLDRMDCTVGMNSTVELQLPGKQTISVQFNGLERVKDKRFLSLELAMKPAVKIQLSIADGGRTLLVGPSHSDGKLILDVSATFKETKK